MERDFVDVQWKQEALTVIGEVKLTAYLSQDEAFRTALGQLLVCAYCQLPHPPVMVMFLDHKPDAKHLALAKRLDVAVVVETAQKEFVYCSESGGGEVQAVFL